MSAAETHVFQRLAGHVLFPTPGLRSLIALRENRRGQSDLWAFGISGDLPLVVVCVADHDGLPLARQALKAHSFWRGRGLAVDLVLLADRATSYREELFEALGSLARAGDSRDVIDKPGGVFVRKAEPGGDERILLLAAARVILYGDRGTLADQTDAIGSVRLLPQELVPTRAGELDVRDSTAIEGLTDFNGTGGFTADGREYAIVAVPPAPWINVIANPRAGCMATDSGLGSTWIENSQTNRLTPWSNDPVVDPPSEVVYIRDEETGHFWSPTPRPAGGPATVRHGAGYTIYQSERDGLTVELVVFVPTDDPVKLLRLSVTNQSDRRRRLAATYFADWIIGSTREQTSPYIVTEIDSGTGILLGRCAFNGDYPSAVSFAHCSLESFSVTGDRTEFLGRNGSPTKPAAMRRVGLSNRTGAALDPCAALMGVYDVAISETREVVFVLGQAIDRLAAIQLASHYCTAGVAKAALREVMESWDRRLSRVRVKTSDPQLDLLVNRWLPYQVLSCRLWGRSAFYQSSGAYGFRDQLQDVMALFYIEPREGRSHILRAAARQFSDGDVQHWWHPPSGRGIRTRFSDDFLWLPLAVARYVTVTGDSEILNEIVPFLRGRPLAPHEQEAYFLPEISDEADTLYGHCLRALDHGWKLGPHGLPLMGCGDWNDGMNLVGVGGVGESVWVAWFQVVVRTAFAEIAEGRGDRETTEHLRAQAKQLGNTADAHAWDGSWYLRAWFDDGTPLGSHTNEECRIDSIAQSWAVFAGCEPHRGRKAIEAAVDHLVNRDANIVKLLEPPFDRSPLEPGYIKGYIPGIRENGGQYTHAAVWLMQALATLGRGDEACAVWRMLSPLSHTASTEGVTRYKTEPYVVAGDVYGVSPHVGRGGWTWYTGSAAWLYRAALETLLGFTIRARELTFNPHLPLEWTSFELEYAYGTAIYLCRVECESQNPGVAEVSLDGKQLPTGVVPLRDDGLTHVVQVVFGRT